jgi:dolichol-phosphate mannosyltransferase
LSPALIVVPTFNEADNLAHLMTEIRRVLPEIDVLIVDDASPDGTAALVRELSLRDAGLFLLERPSKLGLGSAYREGFAWGLARDYQRFFEMDADFSHDPRYLPAFLAELDRGADLVVGSRNVAGGKVEGWGVLRRALSRGGSLYSRAILGRAIRDMTTGYKAYTRRALEAIDVSALRSSGYAFQVETTELALRRGLRVVELPIVFVDRRVGQSKMTWREVAEAAWGVWRLRRPRRP